MTQGRLCVRVLVVDDNDPFAEMLAALLGRDARIEVVGRAANGRLGVALAAELRPDVVLMDLEMPELDGVTATAILARTDVRVVVLTASTRASDRQSAADAGAVGFVTKDRPLKELAGAVLAAVAE